MKQLRNKVKKLLNNEKGGIALIIATIVSIILVLGLVAYAILSQVAGVKSMGDQSSIEQDKIGQMIQEPNTVTGTTVKNYASQASATLTVEVDNTSGADATYPSTPAPSLSIIKENAIYKMEKAYNANGELSQISFTQVDLSR